MGDIKTSTNPPKTKIFVGRLPENAQAQDLRRLFEQYGTVTECDILNRYGFVHMKTEEQAAHAIQNLNNVNFMGSNISVEASTGKKGSREGGPRRGGFGGRGGSRGGGYGPMRGGMGGGMGRPSPYSRPEPYGRPDYGRPEPYGRPDFERRAGGPGGPGPVGPSGPGPAAGGPGMAPMRNGYYDDRRAGDYMDRMDRGADYMDRSAGYMDRVDSYDRGYGDYASRGGPMTASDRYGAAPYREADRAGYSDMRQPYERRDMAARDLPPRDLAPPRMAYDMPPQTYERRDYLADRVGAPADRLGAAGDMYRRRTPPPPQATYGAGYERNGAGLDPYGPPARVGRYPDMPPRRY